MDIHGFLGFGAFRTESIFCDQDCKVWLEDGDVLVLAKKNKQDPTQVQFPDDGTAVCLWIYSISMRISIFMSS